MSNRISRSIVLLGCMAWLSLSQAQEMALLRGHIIDVERADPIPFANIFIGPINKGTASDAEGFFSIALPAGDYNLIVTYLGYDSLEIPVQLQSGQVLYQQLTLAEKSINLNTIEVSADRTRSQRETQIAQTIIRPAEIVRMPSLSIQGDLAQYLTALPGVVTTGEQGGQIYINGGTPDQTLMRVDGTTLVSAFHSLNGFSLLPTEMIQEANVYGAAFDATYGGRISSVIDVRLRQRHGNHLDGNLSFDPFLAQGFIHVPLTKSKTDQPSVHLAMGGKYSLIDRTATALYPQIDEGVPFTFQDVVAKLSVQTPTGNAVSVHALSAFDQVRLNDSGVFDWQQQGIGLNFKLLPPRSKLVVSGFLTFADYNTSIEMIDDRSSSYSQFNGRLLMEYFGENNRVRYGFDTEGASTNLTFRNFADITLSRTDNTTDIAGFIDYQQIFNDRFIVVVGARVPYYASLGTFLFEPRLQLKYNVSETIRIKGAGGRYSQNFLSTRKDEDIVNFFNGFLSSPEGLLRNGEGIQLSSNLQRAWHGLIGMEWNIGKQWNVQSEAYIKIFDPLLELNRNKRQPNDPNYQVETGLSQGVNISLDYQGVNWSAQMNYGYLLATRNNGSQEYPAFFDRRHQINMIGSWNFGSQKKWQLNIRWSLGSGFPFTRTQAFYDRFAFEEGIGTNLGSANGELGILFEERLNQGRLPSYHRLDLSTQRTWDWESTELTVGLSLINVYDRANIFYFDRILYERVDQFPFIPTLGVKFGF